MKKSNLLFALPVLASCGKATIPTEQPNIIMIYVDDMGVGDLSCYGSKEFSTPNIDRMAENGIRFNQYYTAAPVSSPSRTGLTTGMFPLRWDINTYLSFKKHNDQHNQDDFLESSAPSMGRAFQNAGYATAHIGKWHMGGGRDVYDAPQITKYGFDEYVSTYESPDPDTLLTATNWIWSDQDSILRWERTAYFVDKTLDFIKRNTDKPYFINLWPDDMHDPWIPNADYMGKKKLYTSKKAFELVLIDFDKEMGRLLDELEAMGELDNTMIVFTSDNGPLPTYEQSRTNGFRGQKISLLEGGIRMPMIVHYPAMVKPGQVDDESVLCAVDFYPTLCAIAGIPTEENVDFDGINVAGALLGQKTLDRQEPLFWEYGQGNDIILKSMHRSPHLGVRKGDYKLLVNNDGSYVQLYNIVDDPFEYKNLINEKPELAAELKKLALNWWEANK